MLRLGLVEELRRLVDGVVSARRSREEARKWEGTLGRDARRRRPTISTGCSPPRPRPDGRLSAAFVVELLQWLRDQPPSAAPVWLVLQRALEVQGDSPDELLRARASARSDRSARDRQRDHQHAAAVVDRLAAVLRPRQRGGAAFSRSDPAGAYAQMDFPTRDRYRHSIEQLSKRSGQSEIAVAEAAIALARRASGHRSGATIARITSATT